MKKLLATVSLLSMSALTLVGCGYSPEERAEREALLEQGEENCIEYVEDKYGFTPDIVSSYLENVDSSPVINFSPNTTGYAYVNCRHDDKIFTVYIKCADTKLFGEDDYQYNDIKNDLIEYIKEQLDTDYVVANVIFGDYYDKSNTCLIDTYYKNNISDIMNGNYKSFIQIGCVDADVSKARGIKDKYNCDYVQVVSFSNQVDAEKYYNGEIYIIEANTASVQSTFIDYDNGVEIVEKQYTESEIFTFDDNASVTEIADRPSVAYWNGKGFSEAKYVSKAYKLDYDGSVLHYYVDLAELKCEDEERANIVFWYDKEGEMTNTIISSRINEGILSGTIYLKSYMENPRMAVCIDKEKTN